MRISGRFRIVDMDLWDQADLDLIAPAFVEFGPDNMGSFGFLAVEGEMDCRHVRKNNRPAIEFSWEGSDDGTPSNGRGWVVMEADGSLRGHIYFHLGDESGFRASADDLGTPAAR